MFVSLFFYNFAFHLPTMLPTTRATTSKAAQKEARQSTIQRDLLAKTKMINTVNAAILEYATSTGKAKDAAQQELFTIVHLNKRKRTLCAKDIFVQEKMHEINKGMCSNLICIMLGYYCADIHLDKPKGQRTNLMTVRKQFDQDYAALSPEEIEELKQRAEEEQKAKLLVPKQTKRAQKLDVANIADSFQEAVSMELLDYVVVLIPPSLMLSITALATLE